MKKMYCVISHTHWDREWYRSFESFRMRLCDLINNLFDVIEEYPDYIFHLDAQTIVLDDYLEIFPENRNKLINYIKNGNIIIGPWYLQNDFYLTSGEATIRNLIYGKKLAKDFGACGTVGYAPDQFGNISQLPQILNNFGIDNFVFGRGFNPYYIDDNGEKCLSKIPSEFIWRGADGSEVLAIHLRCWYNNAQRFSKDIEKAKALVKRIENSFNNVSATPYILLMNGVDHLEAQEDLIPILDELNSHDINGTIKQTTLADYVNSVKEYVNNNDIRLQTYFGELRKGGDSMLLQGTLSSRHYLKVANVRAQNLIEYRLEPIYSMLSLSGFKDVYPQNYFNYMWKLIMQNHPHDSICGCSRDEVHRHMEDRFEHINEVGEELLISALELAAYHNSSITSGSDYSIVLANTTGAYISGVAEVVLSFPVNENVTNFEITDALGRGVDFKVVEIGREKRSIFSPINLPGVVEVDTYKIYLPVRDMKPMSFEGYCVSAKPGNIDLIENYDMDKTSFENDKIRVNVSKNGCVDIICKDSGRKLLDCIRLEDTADKGTSYSFVSADDEIISSSQFKPVVKMLEKNNFKSVCSISYDIPLPESFDFENNKRSDKTVIEHCELILTIDAFSRMLTINYKIDNKAKDHRMRLCVKSDAVSNCFIADIPFDIVVHEDNDVHPLVKDNVHPNTSFAAIESDIKSVAVFTEGAHECSKSGNDTLKFTLVRSTGVISRSSGKQWITPENQCIRLIEGRLAIYPYIIYESSMLSQVSTAFRNPVLAIAVPGDPHKFAGGRPAVQDSAISEIFHREDKNANARINNDSIVAISNKSVLLTAFKKAEYGEGFIVRLFNSSASGVNTEVTINGDIYISNMNENILEYLGENNVSVDICGKQIITLYVK